MFSFSVSSMNKKWEQTNKNQRSIEGKIYVYDKRNALPGDWPHYYPSPTQLPPSYEYLPTYMLKSPFGIWFEKSIWKMDIVSAQHTAYPFSLILLSLMVISTIDFLLFFIDKFYYHPPPCPTHPNTHSFPNILTVIFLII